MVVRRYIDLLILLIPTPIVSVLFLQQHPYFLFIFLTVLFCNYIFMYLIIFSRSINTYLQLRASHSSHMKAAHTVLYMKKHIQTYASYPAMEISCMSVV